MPGKLPGLSVDRRTRGLVSWKSQDAVLRRGTEILLLARWLEDAWLLLSFVPSVKADMKLNSEFERPLPCLLMLPLEGCSETCGTLGGLIRPDMDPLAVMFTAKDSVRVMEEDAD